MTELLVDELLAELRDELEALEASDSIGPGADSVRVQIYATAGNARWDTAHWDADTWSVASWQEVGCEVLEADYQSGVAQEAGILSVPDAGALDLRTYDPDRLLDPLATTSPLFGAIRPGTPVRIVHWQGNAAWAGFIDEARYNLATAQGRIRAIDAIAYLSQAEVPEGTSLPNTLRARVRAVVNAVGLGSVIPVWPEESTANRDFVTNGGFESGLAGWVVQPADGIIGVAATPFAPEGGSVAQLKGSGGAGFPLIYQDNPLAAGGLYTLSGYVGKFGPDGPGTIRADTILASTGLPTGTVLNLQPAVGGYVFASGTYTVPADGSVLGLRIYCYGSNPAPAAMVTEFDAIKLVGPPILTAPADPPVAAFDGKAASAWSIIQAAALDALTFVWLDPAGQVRFQSWGSLPDATFAVGCSDGLGGAWLTGLASLETIAQADSIRNAVRSWASANTFGTPVKDTVSVARYGERRLDVARIVPNAAVWAQRIIDDRSDAGLEVTLGELRPYTDAELLILLNAAYTGPAALRVRDDAHGEVVDVTVAVLGQSVGITANGWRFRQTTMIPRADWAATPPAPVTPPTPPAGTYHTETRTYIATSDALLALTSGGAQYGAGASSSLPVGVWSGWTYRALLQFPAIPWTKVRRIVSATLDLGTTTQVRVGFGSSPRIECKRITGAWSAGSSSSPSSGNAVVWPGPAVTGSVYANVSASQSATVRFRVDGLVLPWAPIGIGGTGAAQRGLALYPASGSSSDTTEFWPVEASGTASDPTLELVVEVFDA